MLNAFAFKKEKQTNSNRLGRGHTLRVELFPVLLNGLSFFTLDTENAVGTR